MSSVSDIWAAQTDYLFTGDLDSAERTLCSWLATRMDSAVEFARFLECASRGWGVGDDRGYISLPANVVDEALESGRKERGFWVEVCLATYGDSDDEVARLPVPAFLFYSSMATVLHARHLNPGFEPFFAMEQIRRGCAPEIQFALVPERQREAVGLTLTHWQSTANVGAFDRRVP